MAPILHWRVWLNTLPREPIMLSFHVARLLTAALLLGTPVCKSTPPDQGQLQARRTAEFEALSRQAGMPDHYLKDAKAMEAEALVAAQASPPPAR
jgi:hypothetical protein